MTQWEKGQSGNPKGRPKKQRALTRVLQLELSRRYQMADGTFVEGKRYIARIIRQALSNGIIELANGAVITLAADDIIKLLQWSYQHIDGAPIQEIDVSNDQPFVVQIVTGVKHEDL
jgi:hypothetical protein